jgi:hypothetical protein
MPLQSTFMNKQVVAEIATFDRLIFKGHLYGFRYPAAAMMTLATMGQVLLKDWKAIIEPLSEELHTHLQTMCSKQKRPFEYLESAHTHRDGDSKEDMARRIAERDGITDGLVCVFRVLEPCSSYDVRGNHKEHTLELVRRRRRCLHYYVYLIDKRFGWMHVRVQSWIPWTIQVYVNGREWMCRELDRRKVPYRRSDNKIVEVAHIGEVRKAARKLEKMNWPKFLDRWAEQFNPLTNRFIGKDGIHGYFWVTDQCEYATDLLFKDRATVDRLMHDIKIHAHTVISVRDCYRFLGKRVSRSEAIIDLKQRPEGWRGKFRVGRNWIKIYDHANIIRIETTINHAAAFTVRRHGKSATTANNAKATTKRSPLRKGVQDFWLLAKISGTANDRLRAAFDASRITRPVIDHLDRLSKPHTAKGRRIPRLNPTAAETVALFKATTAGESSLRGFSNGDVQRHLYPKQASSAKERRRRTCRICRRLACLRGHGLITRIQGTRRYRFTDRGRATIHAAIRFHDLDFPELHAQICAA